jgi:hypothetical protein
MLKSPTRLKDIDMAHLSAQQKTTLKAAILAEADPEFVAARNNGQTPLLVAWFNKPKVPAVKAWRANVQPAESDEATPWANFDAIAQAGKRDSYLHAFMRYPRDYSKGAVRKWITDVWGNATVGSDAATILTNAGLRDITRAEAVLGGTATATTNSVTGVKLTWVGPMVDSDIGEALE